MPTGRDALARAEAHLAASEPGPASADLLEELGAVADQAASDPRRAARAARLRSRLHAAAGDAEAALAWGRRALETVRGTHRQPDLLEAHLALGALLLELGDADGAESSFRNAVQQARTRPDPARLGRALARLGDSQRALGREDRALLAWVEALPALRAGAEAAEAARVEAAVAAIRRVEGGAR